MKSWVFAAAVFLTVLAGTKADFPAVKYTVSLDANPSRRWVHIYDDLLERYGGWNYTGKPIFDYLRQYATDEQWHEWNASLTKVTRKIIGDDMIAEAASLVQYANQPKIGANITVGQVGFFQVFYELAMECTGVLAQSPTGVLHGRNMDIGLQLNNLTAQVTWTRNGMPLVTSTQYIGYFGIHTGMRHDGWSVQANERVMLTPGPFIGYKAASALMTVASFGLGATPIGIFLREVLTTQATFDTALPPLMSVHLASPVYLIVGGKGVGKDGTGAVITRDRKGVSRSNNFGFPIEKQHQGAKGPLWLFNESESYKGTWVQTNWDWWTGRTGAKCTKDMASMAPWAKKLCEDVISVVYNDTAGCSDLCRLYSDGRREGAMADLEARLAGGAATPTVPLITAVMSNRTSRVLNGITRFTSVMSATTNTYNTIVRTPVSGESKPHTVDPDMLAAGRIILRGILAMGDDEGGNAGG